MDRIYTEEELKSEVFKERKRKEGAEYYIFEIGEYKFGVVYLPDCSLCQHLAFYAMSQGFDQYTDTGYKSNFVQMSGKATREEIEEYFLKSFDEVNLDPTKPMLRISGITKKEAGSMQLGLF